MRSRTSDVVRVGLAAMVALALALVLMPVGIAPAGAQDAPTTQPVGPNANSFGFTVRPYSDASSTPRDDLEYQLAAGQGLVDKVSIANLTDQPKTFYLYPADAYNTPSGGYALRLKTDPLQDAGAWITLPVPTYTIPAKSAAIVPISVNVAADATPGDHAAGIVAEEVVDRQTTAESGGLQPIHRVGTRVYVRVAGDTTARLQVTDISVVHKDPLLPWGDGSGAVTYTIKNTGNVRVSLDSVKTRVQSVVGFTTKTVTRTSDSDNGLAAVLLPGNSVVYAEDIGTVAPLVLMKADVSVQATEIGSDNPVRVSSSQLFWDVPWLLIALLVLLAGAIVAWRLLRRRPAGESDPGDAPPGGDGPASPGTEASQPVAVSSGGPAS